MRVILLASAVLLGGCDEHEGRNVSARGSPAGRSAPSSAPTDSAVAALRADAGASGRADDPAPRGGELAADIAAFTTLDACVASRNIGDAVLGDALLALGYDTFVRDACRVLQAGKEKNAAPCRDIAVSTLRRHCETLVAVLRGQPDACPAEGLGRGREGSCLALAERDVRLCAAEPEPRRVRCEAILTKNAKRCAGDRLGQAACAREVERWGSILGETTLAAGLSPVNTTATFTVVREGGTGSGDAAAKTEPLSSGILHTLASGALILEDKASGTRRLELTSEKDPISLSLSKASLSITVEVPVVPDGGALSKLPQTGRILKAALSAPRGPEVTSPPAKSELVLTWKKLEDRRGGAVELSIDGVVGEGDERLRASVEVKTFVRDFVTAPPLRAEPLKHAPARRGGGEPPKPPSPMLE